MYSSTLSARGYVRIGSTRHASLASPAVCSRTVGFLRFARQVLPYPYQYSYARVPIILPIILLYSCMLVQYTGTVCSTGTGHGIVQVPKVDAAEESSEPASARQITK